MFTHTTHIYIPCIPHTYTPHMYIHMHMHAMCTHVYMHHVHNPHVCVHTMHTYHMCMHTVYTPHIHATHRYTHHIYTHTWIYMSCTPHTCRLTHTCTHRAFIVTIIPPEWALLIQPNHRWLFPWKTSRSLISVALLKQNPRLFPALLRYNWQIKL